MSSGKVEEKEVVSNIQTYAEIALICAVKNAAFPLHWISLRPPSVEKLTLSCPYNYQALFRQKKITLL